MASTKDGQWDQDDDSQGSYEPSDREKTPAPSAPAPRAPTYRLRDSSQIKRPGRYRVDDPVGPLTHPTYIHPRPPFNEDLARLIPWNTVPLDHPGPLSSEMAYERLLAERERKKNDPNAEGEVSFRPFQHVLNGESPRPCVAHLSRKAPPEDPLAYLYTPDESIFDDTKFHPPSDKWSYRDEYNPEFSLDDFDEDQDESQRELERRKAAYVNWSSLSDGIKWAIVHDLSTSYGFAGATQQLGLSVDEVLSFKRLYKREQEKCGAYEARIVRDIQDSLKGAPNECARPFPRPEPDAPPAPALELVTGSISRDKINEGRRFLKFMGLDKHAPDLMEWYGSGSKFHEIPQVLEVDLDFFEEPRYRYPGPPAVDKNRQIDLPQSAGGDPGAKPTASHNDSVDRPFSIFPPSPGMPDPALHAKLRPLIDKKYNPDAMNLARQSYRHPFGSKRMSTSFGAPPLEGPTPSSSSIKHNWTNGARVHMDVVIFDPSEHDRAETERIPGNLNPKNRPAGAQVCAGYRYATEDDLIPGIEAEIKSHFAENGNMVAPYVKKSAMPRNRKDSRAQVLPKVPKKGSMNDFALDGPSRNGGANEQRGQHTTRDVGSFANNTPPLPAVGVISRGESIQRAAGNPSKQHSTGAMPLERTGHAGLANSYVEPHLSPSRYADSDVSDPEFDDFPPEKDDPNDGDYKQRKSGRSKRPASQKRTAGRAELGSNAMAARATKKPRTSRTKSEPSGSNSKRNKKNVLPVTTTGGKGTPAIAPFEPSSAMAPRNKAQRSQSVNTLPQTGMGVPQQSVPDTVPPNMQQTLNVCSDRQLFEMGLLDGPPHQAAVHEENINRSAAGPVSKGPVLPTTYGEFMAQAGANAVTQTPSYPSTAEPENKGT